MRIPKTLSLFCVFMMSLIITHLPSVALAEGMISTSTVVEEMTRAEASERVQNYLSREDVQNALMKQGLSPSQVTSRVASLSDKEMNQLAKQMEQARYGGDPLMVILIVVLIIFLIKRI